jgi:hypothetical protein
MLQALPEDADVEFEVTLLDFDRQPNWHAMGAGDKIARAELLKEQGNKIYRLGPPQYARAAAKWQKALKLLDNAFDIETDEQARSSYCCLLRASLCRMPHASCRRMDMIGRLEVRLADVEPPPESVRATWLHFWEVVGLEICASEQRRSAATHCTGGRGQQGQGGLHDQPGAGRAEAARLQRVLPLVRQGAQVRLCLAHFFAVFLHCLQTCMRSLHIFACLLHIACSHARKKCGLESC